jgi:hypothetical protein
MKSQIKTFPSARHRVMLETIARAMVACTSPDAAEDFLIRHLNIQWDRLELFGVDCDEIEIECQHFAFAAWRRYDELNRGVGAA